MTTNPANSLVRIGSRLLDLERRLRDGKLLNEMQPLVAIGPVEPLQALARLVAESRLGPSPGIAARRAVPAQPTSLPESLRRIIPEPPAAVRLAAAQVQPAASSPQQAPAQTGVLTPGHLAGPHLPVPEVADLKALPVPRLLGQLQAPPLHPGPPSPARVPRPDYASPEPRPANSAASAPGPLPLPRQFTHPGAGAETPPSAGVQRDEMNRLSRGGAGAQEGSAYRALPRLKPARPLQPAARTSEPAGAANLPGQTQAIMRSDPENSFPRSAGARFLSETAGLQSVLQKLLPGSPPISSQDFAPLPTSTPDDRLPDLARREVERSASPAAESPQAGPFAGTRFIPESAGLLSVLQTKLAAMPPIASEGPREPAVRPGPAVQPMRGSGPEGEPAVSSPGQADLEKLVDARIQAEMARLADDLELAFLRLYGTSGRG